MIGQNITFTTDSKIYRDTYKSTVLDIKDNIMTIAMPYHKGTVVLPGVGTRLKVNVEELNYDFACEILDRNIMDKYLKISTPDLSQEIIASGEKNLPV
jgi:c-di-GMP-binding flagellar brake protein YcgR